MMNKKGALILRDIVFMMVLVSAVFIFAGLYVSDIAVRYDNTNMSDEWVLSQTNTLANSTFYGTGEEIEVTASGLNQSETGIYSLITGGLDAIGDVLFMILTAPNTIGDLVSGTLEDAGVSPTASKVIDYLIVTLLWAIVLFTIVSAFLQGGKV